MLALLSTHRAPIVSFDGISSPPLYMDEWSDLLYLPSLRSVRDLRMTRQDGGYRAQEIELLAKIAMMPHLTSFTMIKRGAQHAICIPHLSDCPALTSLALLDSEGSSCLPQLNLFSGLKRLAVIEPCVRSGTLHAAWVSSVHLHRTLEHLELAGFHSPIVSAASQNGWASSRGWLRWCFDASWSLTFG